VRTFCLTLASTGARLAELSMLLRSQVDVEQGAITFSSPERGPSEGRRRVPIPRDLMRMLIEVHSLRSVCGPGPMWPNCKRETASRWVREVMKKAGIAGPAASPKGLRHSFAIAALERGVPLLTLHDWIGYSDIAATAAYASVAKRPHDSNYAERLWIDNLAGVDRAIVSQ
jgi:integrase/recombinase XerD